MDVGTEVVARESRRRSRTILAALVVALALTVLAGSVTTLAWAGSMRDDGRLLPGTSIAAVDVSAMTADEARTAVDEALAARLDRPLTVVHDDVEVTTTVRELGGHTDLDQALADAATRRDTAGFADLVRARWLGADGSGRDLSVVLDEDAVDAFVAEVAEQVDRGPRDAAVDVDGADLKVDGAVDGRQVDRDTARAALIEAATEGESDDDPRLELPVEVTEPAIATAQAEEVAAATVAAVDAALDRAVTVTLEGDSRTVTPRDLDATVDRAALVAAGMDGSLPDVDDVTVGLGDAAVRAVVDGLASGKETAARDAELTVRGGDFDITAERVGAAVNRGEAVARLRDALTGGDDTVGLELATVRPSVTSDSFDTVLVLERSDRQVSLYRGGDRVRQWPVAVGAPDSPTPTGQFTIGAKRFEPTWVNPAPDRWGRDLPARMGPGPDNPLGARALNWNDASGRDTLIRFHGTPNEGSIGSATSNGCVRMFNDDVAELFDMVSTGTVVISTS